jgi:Holliday junction resolvase
MVNFKKTHNITNEQNFRSLIGYAGQELAISRLMMCGFNVLRSLWRDSKYDGMFEANDASIKIEIKQTTKEKFTVHLDQDQVNKLVDLLKIGRQY